ncbi:14084_t:CDS:2 [Acaulospora morrowiae]|uniref:14084_t:CDS:1 n=1 Tax=Acaulospora morrowiae TaxID=94023 RepID=A0A9N8YN47_9GLOM|nr:14084_t:CDS:2 [Acaulospora morrowiae]
MSNLNPAAYANGVNLTNGIVGVPNPARGLTQMHLAMGQVQVPPAYMNLGFPTMVQNMTNINNSRLPPQVQLALAQNQSPPISRPMMQGYFILQLQFLSEHLMSEKTADKKNITYWNRIIEEFFSEDGKMKYELWNQTNNQKRTFDIPCPIIPRFFHVNFESGVISIQLTIGNLRENIVMVQMQPQPQTAAIVEGKTSIIYKYEDGSMVVATGKLKVRFNMARKIESFEFSTDKHTEYVPRHSHIPNESPIGEYGIPVKTLRSLEVAEGVVSLNELISLAISSNKGPLEVLAAVANQDQQTQTMINQSNHNTPPTPGPSPPEPPAKTPKEKTENIASDNTQTSTSNDFTDSSPSTSNANLKLESTTKSASESPSLTNKRPIAPNEPPKIKRTRTKPSPRKNSRTETG